MIIPAHDKVLCQIKYRGHSFIKAVQIRDIECILERLKGASIALLSMKPNRVYGWTPLAAVALCDGSFNRATTNKHGLFFYVPTTVKTIKFVTLPKGFFAQSCSVPELVLGTYVMPNVKSFKITGKIKHKEKKRDFSIGAYLKKVGTFNADPDFIINDRQFNIPYYQGNINTVVDFYLKSEDRFEGYLERILLTGGMLDPVLFSSLLNERTGETIHVDYDLLWKFHLIYGRDNDVRCKYSVNDITVKNIHKTYTKMPAVDIQLKGTAQPVVINPFAMRFIHE